MAFEVHEFNWGYPNPAIFQSSDEAFGLYRRFGYLQSRLLLEKQDALRVLENKLNRFDEDDMAESNNRYSDIHPSPREQLLAKIEEAFNSYGKIKLRGRTLITIACADKSATLLRSSQQLMALNRPTASEYRSVGNFMDQNKPLINEELEHIEHKDDIGTLRTRREHAWLDEGIEHILRWQPFPSLRVSTSDVAANA